MKITKNKLLILYFNFDEIIISPIRKWSAPLTKYWWLYKNPMDFKIGEIVEYHHPEKLADDPPYYLIKMINISYRYINMHCWQYRFFKLGEGKLENTMSIDTFTTTSSPSQILKKHEQTARVEE